jgi:hypothetical protein
MKQYTVSDQSDNVIANIQVDDEISIAELESIYGGSVVEGRRPLPNAQNNIENQTRLFRDELLKEVDKITAAWYSTLSESQQQELQDYRQALLAVPQQAGFPESVEWPCKPTWL